MAEGLVTAILKGDIERVVELLEAGADPNVVDDHGRRPLDFALFRTSAPGLAAMLLEHGADPHVVAENGRTMLHHAAGHSVAAVEALLARGLDPNAVTVLGETPMFFAHADTCEALLVGGAEPRLTAPPAASRSLDEAIDAFVYDDPVTFPDILAHVAAMTDDVRMARYAAWNDDPKTAWVVRLTAPRVAMSEAVAGLVLEQGIREPCPSSNRAWIEPVVEQQGRRFAMERYLAAFRSGDDALAIGVPHAHYWSFGFRRWTFLGPPDRTGPEREASDAAQVALFHAVMDRFLDGAEGSLAHACVGMISLAREKRLPLDEDRLAACEARAVASEDGYLRNRGQIMAGQTPLLQAVPPRRVD